MDKHEKRELTGHPSDYGSRTLAGEQEEERERAEHGEHGEIGRTADGEPRVERGTADSAISQDRDT